MTSSPLAKRFDWANLGLRAASAAILAPVAALSVWFGGLAFLVLVAVAIALLTVEWGEMCDPETPARSAAVISVAVLTALFASYLEHPWISWFLIGLGAVTGALIALWRGRIDRPADIAFGVLYVGAPCVCLVWLRQSPEGRFWTLLLLAVVWSADVGAFIVGSIFKGPKLWPRFSPNKTWAGLIGGLGASVLAAEALLYLQPRGIEPGPKAAFTLGLITGLAAMGGDLWESMLKRRFGVKDSGSLIPGHGGLLDRVDGLMFGAVVMALARWIWGLGVKF